MPDRSPSKRRKRKQSSPFDKYWRKYSIQIIFFLIAFISVVVYWDFISFEKVFLFKDIGSDTITVFYPQYIHIAEYFRLEGLPKWSFNQGMGQNIFPFSLSDPFNWFLYLLGSEKLAYGLVYIEVSKILLGGLFFFLYLRVLSLQPFVAIIGGITYAFSGYMIVGGGWYQFSTEAVHAAMLLYAFEKGFIEKSWLLFPIVIALIVSFMPVNLFLFTIFLAFYTLFRVFSIHGWKYHKLFQILAPMIILGILGMLIGGVFVLTNTMQLIDSPRVSGEVSFFSSLLNKPIFSLVDAHEGLTAISRLFSSDLLGTGSNYKGWYNYLEAPMFYCGLLTLLLFPQIYISLNRRRKILYTVFFLLWLLPVVFPFFRYAFWLFSGNYYRLFSLFFIFPLLLFSLQALHRLLKVNKLNIGLLGITLIFWIGALMYPYEKTVAIINSNMQYTVLLLLIVYAVLLLLMRTPKTRYFAQFMLLFVVCFEMIYFSNVTINNRPTITNSELTQKIGYNDYTVDAIAYLNETDKTFYRVYKDFSSGLAIHSTLNDAKAQNFRDSKSYHAFNQTSYIHFLETANIIKKGVESQTRWAPGLSARPLLQTWAGTKYLLTRKGAKTYENRGYQYIKTFGDVTLLQNIFDLPIGFTYQQYLPSSSYTILDNQQKDISMLKAVILDEMSDNFAGLTLLSTENLSPIYQGSELQTDVAMLKQSPFNISSFSQNSIEGSINLEKPELLFFSIPFDKGWRAFVDGQETKIHKVNIGFMGIMLPSGRHQIRLSYHVPFLMWGVLLSSLGIMALFFLVWKKYLH